MSGYLLSLFRRIRSIFAFQNEDDSSNSTTALITNVVEKTTADVAVQTSIVGSQQEAIIANLRRDKKVLQMKLRRRNERVSRLQDFIGLLRRNNASNDALEDILQHNYADSFPHELFENEVKNSDKSKTNYRYSDEIKKFCLTLYYYSPKAYNFLRCKSRLPNPKTIQRWLSSRKCYPGILSEVLKYLAGINGDHIKDVALIFDSMSIRKTVAYDKANDRHVGYVDLGGIHPVDAEELASELLLFAIVSYTKKFKCPAAYFFVNKPNANVLAQLTQSVICELYAVGVTVRSVTCDGPVTNLRTLEVLGCVLQHDNLEPSFKHPCDETVTVHCILDPVHMLKLARNFFSECRMISSEEGNIDFMYVKQLNEIQEKEGLKFANKVSFGHIQYKNKVMNVSIAAQTLSSSVADALQYLKQTYENFKDCGATITFIRVFDRLFDVQNTRNNFGKGYKEPLSLQNRFKWEKIFKESEDYIKTLTCNGRPIFQHNRRTFAIGFLVNIISFKNLAFYLLHEKQQRYFLTYKTCQDHVELIFSCIRGCGGWNNNPSALQVRYTLRKMLFRNSVTPSPNANCTEEDGTCIEPCFPLRNKHHDVQEEFDTDDTQEDDLNLEKVTLSEHCENILFYIAGKAVKAFLEKYPCSLCEELLYDKTYLFDHSYNNFQGTYKQLTFIKNRGKLVFSSKFVFDIVRFTETIYRLESIKPGDNFKKRIIVTVVKHFISQLSQYPSHPVVDTTLSEDLHEIKIVKFISTFYSHVRIYQKAKETTINATKKFGLRQRLNKTVLFLNI